MYIIICFLIVYYFIIKKKGGKPQAKENPLKMAKSSTVSKSSKTKKKNSKTRIRISVSQSKAPPRSANKPPNQVLHPARTPRPSPPMVKPLTLKAFLPPLVFSKNHNPLLILTWQRSPLVAPRTTTTLSMTSSTIAPTVSRPMVINGSHFSFRRKSGCPMAPMPPSPCLLKFFLEKKRRQS